MKVGSIVWFALGCGVLWLSCAHPDKGVVEVVEAPEAFRRAHTASQGLAPFTEMLTVVVRRDAMELVDRREPGRAAQRVMALADFRPVAANEGLLLRPLFLALDEAVSVEKVASGVRPRSLSVVLDEAVSYEVIVSLMYTVGMVGFDDIHFEVNTADGSRLIRVDYPKVGVAFGPVGHGEPVERLSSAAVRVTAEGFMVRAHALFDGPDRLGVLGSQRQGRDGGLGDRSDGEASVKGEHGEGETEGGAAGAHELHGAPARQWPGALMVARPGACPSVPLKEGRHDFEGLRDLVSRILGIEPGAESSLVSADKQIVWKQVAPTLQAMNAMGLSVMLFVDDVWEPQSCAQAVVPEDFK